MDMGSVSLLYCMRELLKLFCSDLFFRLRETCIAEDGSIGFVAGDDAPQLSEAEVRQLPKSARAVLEKRSLEAAEQRQRIDTWNSAIEDLVHKAVQEDDVRQNERPASPARDAVDEVVSGPRRPISTGNTNQRWPGSGSAPTVPNNRQEAVAELPSSAAVPSSTKRGSAKSLARKRAAGDTVPADAQQSQYAGSNKGGSTKAAPTRARNGQRHTQDTSQVEPAQHNGTASSPAKRARLQTDDSSMGLVPKHSEVSSCATKTRPTIPGFPVQNRATQPSGAGQKPLRPKPPAGCPPKKANGFKASRQKAVQMKSRADVANASNIKGGEQNETAKDAADSLAEYLAEVDDVLNSL